MISAFGYYIWFEYSEIAAFIPILAPVIGYFVVAAFEDRNERIHFGLFSWKEIGVGCLLPLFYIIPAVFLSALFSGKMIELGNLSLQVVFTYFTKWVFAGICEEIGWRGFLLPALKKHMARPLACILCGIIWGGWHIPMLTNGDLVVQYPVWISIVIFLVETVAITFILDSIEGNSIWRFVSFHATHNIFIQIGVAILVGNGKYFMDDGGAVLIICIIVMAVLLNMKRKLGVDN